jgi:hypothetical protein
MEQPKFVIQLNGNYLVYLSGRRIGTIKREVRFCMPGYRYFPKGQKIGGDWFGTASRCMQSLRTEEING